MLTGELTYRQNRAAAIRGAWIPIIAAIGSILLFSIAPGRSELPSTLVSITAYFFAMVVWPNSRLNIAAPLCPVNMALMFFGLQLVVLPLLAVFFGFSRGTLMYLPSDHAKNIALLITTIAYLTFSIVYHISSYKKTKRGSANSSPSTSASWYPDSVVILVPTYAVIGLIGFYFYYGGWGQYIVYLTTPASWELIIDSLSGTIAGAASTFFRPFLGFAVVLAWSIAIDNYRASQKWALKGLLTIFVAALILFINIGFSYNRGAVFGPMIALAAAYSSRIRRIPIFLLLFGGSILLSVALIWGVWRGSGMTLDDLNAQGTLSSLSERADLVDVLQVYGAAPQFSGFLLEQSGYGRELYWGQTLVSSLLYPVPVLGKAFRSTSGVEIFNRMIYGEQGVVDQIVPFQAELFINFHLPGVVLGYALLGLLIARFQRAFESAENSFETYVIFLMSLSMTFLIPWSLAVVSQFFIYMYFAAYVYFLRKRFSPRTPGVHDSIDRIN